MHRQLMTTSVWQKDSNWTREAVAAGVRDTAAFHNCLSGSAVQDRLAHELSLADSVGARGTPYFVSRNALHRGTITTTDLLAMASKK